MQRIVLKNILGYILVVMGIQSSVLASSVEIKHTLTNTMQHFYHVLPPRVNSLEEMFEKGMFYGRLRTNAFLFDWGKEVAGKTKDNHVLGVGGSVLFKSAYFHGFSITTGLYTTQTPWDKETSDVRYYKSGKDVLSRYDVLSRGEYGISTLGQAYVQYKDGENTFALGRLLFESFLTKSNDTKMIPNAFEGIRFQNESLDNTCIKVAYLTKQKLRDHRDFHHLLAYGDNPSDPYAPWHENDDAAMHVGITESALHAKGIKDRLFIFESSYHPLENLSLIFNYTSVRKLISSSMIQAGYRYEIKHLAFIPAVRFMKQFDDGAGAIGGANLKNNTFGYTQANSLDGSLLALRLDVAQNAWKLRFGFSDIADKGDIIAPWRGFPTGGFARAMGQYNWNANTKTYMFRADYDFDKSGLVDGLQAFIRYAEQDFDDTKPGVQADSDVISLDMLKCFDAFPNLYVKSRVGIVHAKNNIRAGDGTLKSDTSYNEYRFEINYLF